MEKEYVKIFSGNAILAGWIIEDLKKMGITPVVKDESESGRLAGFASPMQGDQEIYVQSGEAKKAKSMVDQIQGVIDPEP